MLQNMPYFQKKKQTKARNMECQKRSSSPENCEQETPKRIKAEYKGTNQEINSTFFFDAAKKFGKTVSLCEFCGVLFIC